MKATHIKTVFTLLLLLITGVVYGHNNDTYNKLCELNKCWAEQQGINHLKLPPYSNYNEHEWIRIHLQLVEQTLRARNTETLSATQKANRQKALDHLNQYWHEGNFPINDQYRKRTPIFIDPYDNFCAVGYLVKATGHEEVSRMIAANTNLAYVREMNYPELNQWAKEYGFTTDELAWIQPNYTTYPNNDVKKLGGGTNGPVYDLFVDSSDKKMYVSGLFNIVDSHTSVSNIAYVTDSNNTYIWYNMGQGVNGPVYCITEYNNQIIIGGHFNRSGSTAMSSITYWDDTAWQRLGCIDGIVKKLLVYNNELYACGRLHMCNGPTDINFVKWSGTAWQAIPGVSGWVNTMTVYNNELVLGGDFTYNGQQENIIKWDATKGFSTYEQSIDNTVQDITEYKGKLIAGAKSTVTKDELLYEDSAGYWKGILEGLGDDKTISYNTLHVDDDKLWVGGNFKTTWTDTIYRWLYVYTHNFVVGLDQNNALSIKGNGFYIDGAINKFVTYKGKLIGAGSFSRSFYGYSGLKVKDTINNIFFYQKPIIPPPQSPLDKEENTYTKGDRGAQNLSIAELDARNTAIIYPNPAKDKLHISNNFNATQFRMYDVTGKLVNEQVIKGKDVQINLPILTAGIYTIELKNNNGERAVEKLTIR